MTTPARSVLVVAASASVGSAVVGAFLASGSRVLGTYHRSPLHSANPSFTAVGLDLLDEASVERFVEEDLRRFGLLDVAVFLAGVLPGRSLADYRIEDVDRVMSINFTAQARLVKRMLDSFAADSHLVMVSSIAGERGSYDPIYAASKAAVIAFVRSLSTWLAPRTRANAIAPALIGDSRMYDDMTPQRRDHHLAQTPTGRFTTKEALAQVIVDICRPAWSNLNGQVIRLNGGQHV